MYSWADVEADADVGGAISLCDQCGWWLRSHLPYIVSVKEGCLDRTHDGVKDSLLLVGGDISEYSHTSTTSHQLASKEWLGASVPDHSGSVFSWTYSCRESSMTCI